MSFDFGIGDFLALLDMANRLRKRFINAPTQFQAIHEEIKTLSNVLRDIEDYEPDESLDQQRKKSLNIVSNRCQSVLSEVEKTLDKYQELSCSPKPSGSKAIARRTWKRMIWDQEEINEFRSRISQNITSLNLLLIGFNSHVTQQTKNIAESTKVGVDRLVRQQDQEKFQKIVEWLSSVNPKLKQSDLLRSRQEGTGQWFLETDCFRQWVHSTNQDEQTLFCPGIPGAGKTLLASTVVNEIHQSFQHDKSVGLAFFYCDFRESLTIEAILGCLLAQLAQRLPVFPELLEDLYDDHLAMRTRPTTSELVEILHVTVSRFLKVFVVIDALDECEVSDGTCTTVIEQIFSLQKRNNLAFLATSRDQPDISIKFEGLPCLRIRATEGDIEKFLRGQMRVLPNFVQRSPELQTDIVSKITEAVDGMFLLARLHIDSLRGNLSPKKVRNALNGLSGGLDTAYQDAIRRIEGQMPEHSATAKEILAWIICATRPLTPLELQHALAIEIGEPCLDEDNLPEINDLVSVCAGLVTIDEQSKIVRLAHYTTQEYLQKNLHVLFPDAHRQLGTTCISYLCFNEFKAGFAPSHEELEHRLRKYPLYSYSSQNWALHSKSQNIEMDMILKLLRDDGKVSACSQALMTRMDPQFASQRVLREIKGLHLAVYLGLYEAAKVLLAEGSPVDVQDGLHRTPLSWMAEVGHERAVEFLLSVGANANSTDLHGQSPLSYAVLQGHKSIFSILKAAGAHAEYKDTHGRSPLFYAIWGGHEDMVEALLRESSDTNCRDNNDQTPLIHAIQHTFEGRFETTKRLKIVEMLLKAGMTPNIKDKVGGFPLFYAVQSGNAALVTLLLQNGADVKCLNHRHETVLSVAVARGYENVVKTLLKWGADPECKDHDGQIPLSAAATRGNMSMVSLLLAGCAQPDCTDDLFGKTALSYAAWKGHAPIVRALLMAGANPNCKDLQGRTPLSWAAEYGHLDVITVLLDESIETAFDDDLCHNTPLAYAESKGHTEVVDLLLRGCRSDTAVKFKPMSSPTSEEESHGSAIPFKWFNIEH